MKNKAFTLIELMVIICIIAMLLAIAVPGFKKVKDLINGVQTVEDQMAAAEIVQLTNGKVAVTLDVAYKIELKPAFNGAGVNVYLSELPENSEIIQENGKTYLYWVPTVRKTTKTTLITAAAGTNKEQEITLMVR